jgi:hypothetical protein
MSVALVAAHLPSVLVRGPAVVPRVRNDWLDPTLQRLLSPMISVVAPVQDQSVGSLPWAPGSSPLGKSVEVSRARAR